MGVATTMAPDGLGTKNPTKKLAHVGVLLGHMLSQNHPPEIFDPGPLLKVCQNCFIIQDGHTLFWPWEIFGHPLKIVCAEFNI